MDVKWLDDFLALVDCRSFTHAAQRRHTSQSGLSRRIQSLEQWAGASLVNREANPLDLTLAGRRFLPIATNLRSTLIAARHVCVADGCLPAAPVTLAIAEGFETGMLAQLLRKLRQQEFVSPVRIVMKGLEAASAALLDGTVELWLAPQHAQWPLLLDPEIFEAATVAQDRLSPVVGIDSGGRPLYQLPGTREQPIPLIANGSADDLVRITDMQLQTVPSHAHLQTVCTADSLHSLSALVRQGLGLAFLPESMVRDELRRGELALADSRWSTCLDIRLVRVRSASARGPAAEAAHTIWNHLAPPRVRFDNW
ncbi:MAG: LysR family transcriptional regulator [Pseudomonadota bacterium]